jgi:hypothetical protein
LVKREYKLWYQADQNAYISDFEIYEGKNEKIEEEFREFGLGKRVVLSLTKPDRNQHKIVYADNYFMSITLLEKLRLKNTLGCGTIQNKRKDFLTNMKDDKTMVDNRVVNFSSNFHSTQETTVKRTQKDDNRIEIKCPMVISDYNKYMGGVDKADQRRANYGVNRRSRKWWHRLFWCMLHIAFVNAHAIYNKLFEEKTTLEFRRSITLGLIMTNKTRGSSVGSIAKKGSIITASPTTLQQG